MFIINEDGTKQVPEECNFKPNIKEARRFKFLGGAYGVKATSSLTHDYIAVN
jgi:hypothetical protein